MLFRPQRSWLQTVKHTLTPHAPSVNSLAWYSSVTTAGPGRCFLASILLKFPLTHPFRLLHAPPPAPGPQLPRTPSKPQGRTRTPQPLRGEQVSV